MFKKTCSVSSDIPLASDQLATKIPSKRKFGKKLYITIVGIIVVAVVAVAFIIPQGSAIIPLNVNYTVGEKMVYDTTLTMTFQAYNSTLTSGLIGQLPNSVSANAKQSIEVIGFDGEYYTLNHTSTMMLNDKPFSFSMLEKMNKTGYSTYIFNLGNTEQEIPNTSITSNSYLTQLLNKPEVKVGDTINVPFPSVVSSMGITGDLTMTFRGFEELTVPAGTYKVFRIDITSNNLGMNYNPSIGNASINLPTNINMDMDMSYQIYIEYGTMRQIKSTMQETVSYQSAIMNYTMHLSTDMTLNQHTKP